MKIGIFTKFDIPGGSEFRAAIMANAIVQYTNHQSYILAEKTIPREIRKIIDKRVNVIEKSICNPNLFYELDNLLVINTDSHNFSRQEYWNGQTDRNNNVIDTSKIRQMVFLYNYIIGPAKNLNTIKCGDVRIIAANTKFSLQLNTDKRFSEIRNIRHITLESPIQNIKSYKKISNIIKIGRHSSKNTTKFNPETVWLIKEINKSYKDKIVWDFMGVPDDYNEKLSQIDNVIVRPPFSIDVNQYLSEIDVFLFFIQWSASEAWNRSIGEALTSGCPVLATNIDGNRDQIINGYNGYLCNTVDEFIANLGYLINNPDAIRKMGSNSIEFSKQFTAESVINKYMSFILS